MFVNSKTLSTEVIWFSNSVDWRIPHCSIPVSPIACVMASPTFPPVLSVGDKETMSVTSLQLYIMGHRDIKTADKSYENVAVSKYLETITNNSA
jgi:hypothetical protein